MKLIKTDKKGASSVFKLLNVSHCSGYASPLCSRQHVQTFLPLTSVVEVTELVATGSRETSKQSLPSADTIIRKTEGQP